MGTPTLPAPIDVDDPMLRLAVAAHLARYKGLSRAHTASDLNTYLRWCVTRDLMPLEAQRGHVELYLRWLQEVRRLKPSTVSRRLSVLATFYRTCVIDGVLEHSPAEYVGRPHVPPGSPTLGLSHLQFEAMLTAGRDSANPNDFALVAMLGLLGLRIFEATGADIAALGEGPGSPRAQGARQGRKDRTRPTPARGRPRRGPCGRGPHRRSDPAQPRRTTQGPSRRHSATSPPGRGRRRLHRSHAPAHAS
jgi:integrase/recombinase XerD